MNGMIGSSFDGVPDPARRFGNRMVRVLYRVGYSVTNFLERVLLILLDRFLEDTEGFGRDHELFRCQRRS